MAIGAFFYRSKYKNLRMTSQLYAAVLLGTVSTLAYLMLSTPTTASWFGTVPRLLQTRWQFSVMYSLAAEVCPLRAEVAVMATLIAVKNLAVEGSDIRRRSIVHEGVRHPSGAAHSRCCCNHRRVRLPGAALPKVAQACSPE